MSHKRQAIRDAIVTKLVNASTSAGTRVKSTRIEPIRTAELPCISVYSVSDQVDLERTNQTAPRKSWRDYQIAVVAWVSGSSDTLDDDLDDIAAQIERALSADEQLNESAEDLVLVDTAFDLRIDGARPLGAVGLTYSASYYTDVPDPLDVGLQDLKTADIRITSLDGGETELQQDEQPFEAHDQLTGLEG